MAHKKVIQDPAGKPRNLWQAMFSRRRKIGWGPASAILVTLGIYIGAQLLSGVVIGIYGELAGYKPSEIEALAESSTILQFIFILLVSILTLAMLYFFMNSRSIKLRDIGLGRWPVRSDLWGALVTFGLYFLVLLVAVTVVGGVFEGIDVEQKQQIGFDGATGFGPLSLVFVGLVLLPPLVEEILIRGFLYSGLRSQLRVVQAAVVASLLFAAAHLQIGSGEPLLWIAAIDTFILSLFLINLREKTGSLWAGMTVHFIKNGLAFVSLFIVGVV